jgi:beta-lactamase regulating signal transducer with metallopeptidase domain
MTLWRFWMSGQIEASITLAILLAIVTLFRHRLSPRLRSGLLAIGLVRLALPPWIPSPWSEALVDLPLIDDGRTLMAVGMESDVARVAATITTLVSIFLLARIAWTFATAEQRWIARTDAPPADFAAAGGARIRISRHGEGPLAAGFFRKLIVLPESVLRLDRAAIDAVIAHETAHHERRDLAWIAGAEVLRAIAWFNPLAHVAFRALVAAREDGCDDWAVSRTSSDRFAYAQALLQSARVVAGPQPLGAAGAHPMGARLRRLLDGSAVRDRRLGIGGAVILLLAAAAVLPGAHVPSPDRDDDRVVIVIRQ